QRQGANDQEDRVAQQLKKTSGFLPGGEPFGLASQVQEGHGQGNGDQEEKKGSGGQAPESHNYSLVSRIEDDIPFRLKQGPAAGKCRSLDSPSVRAGRGTCAWPPSRANQRVLRLGRTEIPAILLWDDGRQSPWESCVRCNPGPGGIVENRR